MSEVKTKKWWDSTTIVAAIKAAGGVVVAFIAAIVLFINTVHPGAVSPEEAQQVQTQIPEICAAIAVAVGSVFSLWEIIKTIAGRLRADTPIK